MAINYGIHQEGDSYVISPRLVNGDGYIGLGDEVKVHIGAGNADDTLITPNLQLTGDILGGGAPHAGTVLKCSDSQGTVRWVRETGFKPFNLNTAFISYTYVGTSTATEGFDAASSATLEHTPSNPSDNLRVYIGTGNELTEEVPRTAYTISENTLTFSPALTDHFVVVYSYATDISVVDEMANVFETRVPLMHEVKNGTTVTVANGPTDDNNRTVFVAGTDYNIAEDRWAIEFIADSGAIGRDNHHKFVTIDNAGQSVLGEIGSPRTAFMEGFPQSVKVVFYDTFTHVEEEGTLDANKSYTAVTSFGEGAEVHVERVVINDEEVEYTFDGATNTVTVESASENDAVTVEFGVINHYEDITANVTDGVVSLTVPAYGTSNIAAAAVTSVNDDWYFPNQDYQLGGEDGHSIVLLDHPINNQVLAYDENGDPVWVAPWTLIDNPGWGDMEGRVVVYSNGHLEFRDSAATVELENLVPEDGRQDSYILAWDGTQERVVWKIDNDTWPAVRDASTASGQFLVSTVSGGIHTAGWTDDITLPDHASFSLTTGGTGEITLGSSNHIDISTDGNGNTAGIDIVASNSNDTTGSSVGVKAYNNVTMETVSGNIEMTSGHGVTVETSDSDNADAGNITIQAGNSAVGDGGSITIKSGSGDTHDGKLLLDTSTLQIQGLSGMAANMVLYIQSVDPNTGVATLGVTTVDSLVMTSGH